jgi:3-dehydrosphinganine reductase
MDYLGKSVFISGGSRGIGLAVAELLASKGANIVIAARDEARIGQAVTQIKTACKQLSQQVSGIKMDVSQDGQVEQIIKEWLTQNSCPDILINSAGYAHPGLIEELSMEVFHKTMDVNYFGIVNLTKAFIPEMKKRGSGIIVNISSVSASKFAVTGFSDALRNEMKPYGVNISIVFPPDTDTEQLAYENQYKPEITKLVGGNAGLLTPQYVAKNIVSGMEKKKYIITPGFEASLFYWLHNAVGKLTYTVLDWMTLDAWKKLNSKRGDN